MNRTTTILMATLAILCCSSAQAADKSTPQFPWPAGRTIALGGERQTVITAGKQVAPVLARADVLVVGSSLDGCFLAQRIAAPNRRVILTSAGTSLPREIAMALRPWVRRDNLTRAPADVKSFLTSCKKSVAGDEIIFDMIKLTEGLEDRVLDKGVGLYYDLHPCGVRMTGRNVTAVIFACKGGLVAIEAGVIVDCTEDGSLAALAGAETRKRESASKGALVRYSMLCGKLPKQQRAMTVKTAPQLAGGRVVMHGDFAEFRLRLPVGASAFDGSVRNLAARRLAALAAMELKQSGVLGAGYFARGGDVLLTDPTRRIVSRSTGRKLTLDACRPKGIDNLLVCGPTVDVDDALAASLVEPLGGPSLADVIAPAPWSKLSKGQSAQAPTVRLSRRTPGSGKAIKGQARFTELSPMYRTSGEIAIGGIPLDVIADCDVLVVGAGTSGMPAALTAAESGAVTIVVEKYGDVGGTHTIGGVSKYWFGRRTEFVNRIDADARAMMTRSGMPKCMGMLSVLMRARARLVTHCLAVGAFVDGRTVLGAVVLTPRGLGVIRAKRVIDATGDGDIAARAGAKTEYGTRRDAMTLWCSFAQYSGTNPEASRHFQYVVDPRDPTDMTRAIIAGRRFKKRRPSFPQVYLTPRQSRRISGEYRVTVSDILAQRRFEDMIIICRANFDIKGIADSDLSFSGYVEWTRLANYSVQIPYRAIVPRDLDNILVVGKAYSVSHDTLSLARMQRDMMALGGAAGLIAAGSVQANTPLARIDAKALQAKLVTLGVLSQEDLKSIKGVTDNELPPVSKDELRRLIGQLATGKLQLDGQVNILARPKAAAPLLKEALAKADGKAKVQLARALCFLGDPSGSQTLLDELTRLLAGKDLPGVTRLKRLAHRLPDHGYAPDETYLINTLARMGDKRIIPFMTNIAARVHRSKKTSGFFGYVFSICYAAERLADPACLKALETLAAKPGLHGGFLPRGSDPRRKAESKPPWPDRIAYLEFCIARARARCGSREGYDKLLEALGDIRGFIARSAHDELVALTGLDHGYDAKAWRTSLRSVKITPKSYRHDATAPKGQ